MADKTSFTADEWTTLRNVPHLVAAATMMAGSSGLGTVKEGFTTAKRFMEAGQSPNALIRNLATREELSEGQSALRELIQPSDAEAMQAELRALALDKSRSALHLLAAKGSPEDAEAYRKWIMHIADSVAEAAKEGGFLGIGGERVSEPEQAFLKDLSTSIQT